MAAVTNATPLIALDAVVIDTETTGLDPRKARLVEIGAVRLASGRIEPGDTFRSLVQPNEPVSPKAVAVHGIDAGKLAGAPVFSEIWPKLSEFVGGNSVLIGHTLGFDLAILQRECARANIAWERPRALDTQLLAQVIEPNLGGYSLEQLVSWLGVEMTDRHSALGDALTTARVFRALVPKLREGGIRTFAEAAQACRALTNVLDAQHRAGWAEAVTVPGRVESERTFSRIDSYPYRHRISEIMSAPPKVIAADQPLGEALQRMIAERVSSLYVRPAGSDPLNVLAADAGIVTERDVLRGLAIEGSDSLKFPVEQFMSKPLAVIPADAFIYRAIGRMDRLKLRHLGVVDEAGMLAGALSARDLLRLRAGEAIALGDEIDEAEDVHALGRAWAKLPHVAASLLAEAVSARDIAAVISRELGALTRQAAIMAERRMQEAGLGQPPCAYAFAVLGSGGRGECLLAMDQDNALVFVQGAPDSPEDRWFEMLATHVADILHEVGVPYCRGGVMAKNPQWRGSVATWRERVQDWIGRSRPEDLLAVDIFFDLRGVHGQAALADSLWRSGFDAAKGNAGFAKLLAEAAGEVERGLGFFGGLRTSQGRIDLKKAGLFGIVSFARVLAIRHHVLERSTPARLAGIKALSLGGDSDLDAIVDAQGLFLDLVLDQQIDDIHNGRQPTNAISVKRLSVRDRERLQGALQALRALDTLTRDLLFGD